MSTVEPLWIRFIVGRRAGQNAWHAVYIREQGGYFTFCAQYRRESAVELQPSSGPPADDRGRQAPRCKCCRSRLRLPYLVPSELRQLAKGATA